MTEVATKPIVEAHFTGTCGQDALFTLVNINPTRRLPSMKPIKTLRECRTEQDEVAEQRVDPRFRSRTISGNRELNDPHGPIRTLDRKMQALRAVYELTFKETMGLWPHELRDLGIS